MERGVKEWQRNGGRGETQKYENEEEIGRQITIDCMVALLCKVWTPRRSEGREGISRCHLDGGRRDRLGFQFSSFRWWISSLLWRGFGFFFEVDRITADCTCRWLNVLCVVWNRLVVAVPVALWLYLRNWALRYWGVDGLQSSIFLTLGPGNAQSV